jgi:hypothetical protein
MSTLRIPAGVLADVREALFGLMGDAAEALSHVLEQPGREQHPEWFHAGRGQLGQVFALLDLIGWDDAPSPLDVEVDPSEHAVPLREALDSYLPLLEDQEREAEVDDQRRAREHRPPRRQEIARRLEACCALGRSLTELA